MRVLVAGSSGLIGTALVAELRGAGHEVLRLVRRRTAAPDERGWDPPSGRIAADALDGVDAVVNLCGASVDAKRWSAARKQVIRDSRTEPTEVIAAAVAAAGVPILLNASAIGYYGDTGDRFITETDPPGEGFLAGLVAEWEAATEAAAQAGARVVRMRNGHVLSRSGGLLRRMLPYFTVGLGSRMGNGSQYQSWISLADAVAAIRFVLEHDEISGPVNIVGPAPATNREFTRELGKAIHRPTPWIAPGFALKIVFGEVAGDALTGQRVVPTILEQHGFTFTHPTLPAALRAAVQ
jgi:uncharacterized protein (TIGR01777 family)